MPRFCADERNEAHLGQRLFANLVLADARDAHQHLRGRGGSDRNHHAAADLELCNERRRRFRSARRDRDRIVRCMRRQTERAITADDMHVGHPQTLEPLRCRRRQQRHALDRVNLFRDATEDRRGIT